MHGRCQLLGDKDASVIFKNGGFLTQCGDADLCEAEKFGWGEEEL